VEIPEGWGVFLRSKNGNSLRDGGMDIFWNYTIDFLHYFAKCRMIINMS